MVDLQTSLPIPALRKHVRLYVQRKLSADANLNEPVLARLGGLFEFHFSGLYRVPIVGTDRCEPCAPVLVVGPISHNRVQLQADGAIEAVTVMFQPHGLYELFEVPAHYLAEHAEEGHGLIGKDMTELHQALGNAKDFSSRVLLLDAFLERYAAGTKASSGIEWSRAFELLARSPQRVKLKAFADALNTNVRQLERKALDYTGMSPQAMRRVARFGKALQLRSCMTSLSPLSWTDIAHRAGYYDQMHMIREFRILGGAVPTTLVKRIEPHHGLPLILAPLLAVTGPSR